MNPFVGSVESAAATKSTSSRTRRSCWGNFCDPYHFLEGQRRNFGCLIGESQPFSAALTGKRGDKRGFWGGRRDKSPGGSIRTEAHLASSGCCSLTFNITERREVQSQVPYMHICPPANVRGGRSCTCFHSHTQTAQEQMIPAF